MCIGGYEVVTFNGQIDGPKPSPGTMQIEVPCPEGKVVLSAVYDGTPGVPKSDGSGWIFTFSYPHLEANESASAHAQIICAWGDRS